MSHPNSPFIKVGLSRMLDQFPGNDTDGKETPLPEQQQLFLNTIAVIIAVMGILILAKVLC